MLPPIDDGRDDLGDALGQLRQQDGGQVPQGNAGRLSDSACDVATAGRSAGLRIAAVGVVPVQCLIVARAAERREPSRTRRIGRD